ncbi:major royal jelly family protein [Burkholderia gladioli]|uniref:major royal jelly family protein n=1 Tax=Burkholderia gladioli TaxID=28095 RepID=UPI001FC8B3E6|nr:major royal jelly family protein [Burkholderia gladioli]
MTPRILLSSLLALFVACSFGAPAAGAADATALELVAQSTTMPWNAVALDARGRIFVSSPKWTGGTGPALATIEADGRLAPYPDATWNGWTPGADAARAFVSINAIHREADGSLWIVDTGSPEFGGTPVPNGAKLVQVDPREDRVLRVYPFPASAIRAHTYVDDVRIHGRHAYLTDAGEGAILVLDLDSGAVRRRFDGMAFAQAAPDARIVVAGRVLRGPDGRPLRVNADPLELSPDGKTFYFGPLSGPMSRIETRYLDDDHLSDAELARHVRRWFALPPVGGTAMDAAGNLYYTPLADNTLMRRAPDGRITRLARDARLRWVDAPFLDGRGHLYLPVPQIDGAPVFNHGHSTMRLPIALYRVRLPAD